MSFVSIMATSDYVTVVSDGRAMNNGKVTDENVQKFVRFGNSFIAYAGVQNIADLLIKGVQSMGDPKTLPLQVIGLLLQTVLSSVPDVSKHNLLIAFGGKNDRGEIELYSITSQDARVVNRTPKNGELTYLFLTGSKVNCQDRFTDLLSEFGYSNSESAIQVQDELNDYVAQYDNTVNTSKTHLKIER